MGIFNNLFGKKTEYNEKRVPISFSEKDNFGTRQETMDQANSYWILRNVTQKFDPFVLYTFEKESDARDALLELDCIHVAQDTGKLICTEPLYFGYYRRDDGKYSAVVLGESLTYELWVAAKYSFAKHRGQRKNDQEPETRDSSSPETKIARPDQVTFVQEKRQQGQTGILIYRIYKAPDAVSAKAFLQQNPVNERLNYIVVETPDGNYGRDIDGMYKE
jgi:hypothetical protein